MHHRPPLACIVPPQLLKQLLLDSEGESRRSLTDTMSTDSTLRQLRTEVTAHTTASLAPQSLVSSAGRPRRAIYDMKNSTTSLGTLVRAEGQPPSSDVAVNEAYDAFGATYKFYWEMFQRDSIDDRGMTIDGLVHYGQQYDNAFWDGSGHMMFGDGDGTNFIRFTKSLDVIGHELTHGVTQYTAKLVYSGQPGALNESTSDVLGSCVKQYALGQDVTTADWLIGAEIVGPNLTPALRSLKAPGTANKYDDQPAKMSAFVHTSEDSGGVHTNSGIPNHAFYLAAIAIGGHAWEKAGSIWYHALRDPQVKPNSTFASFARATIRQAHALYGATSPETNAMTDAWKQVEVLK